MKYLKQGLIQLISKSINIFCNIIDVARDLNCDIIGIVQYHLWWSFRTELKQFCQGICV